MRFDALVGDASLPGAGFVVLDEHGSLYQRFAGAISAGSPIPLASATKWLTTVTMLALVEEGFFSLDTNLAECIPETPETHRAITIRQLLSHTSGIDPQLALRLPPSMPMREMAQALLAAPLIARPGEVFAYGGSSMQVAAHAAERRAGAEWSTLFETRLAARLGLTSINWLHPVAPAAGGGTPMVAGGLVLSPNDLEIFLAFILNRGVHAGRRLLSARAIGEIERLQTGAVREFRRVDVAAPEWRYGLGVWCERIEGDEVCSLVSSPGAFGAVPWVDRTRGRAGFFITQARLPRVMRGALELRDLSNSLVR
jgi:CubicO group peptidase (beta-lactamase class C family)